MTRNPPSLLHTSTEMAPLRVFGPFSHLEPPDAFEAEDVISLESLIRTDRGFVHETEVQLLEVVGRIVDRFADHVKDYPFEDGHGGYFDSPALEP